jgi:hypothetical protein
MAERLRFNPTQADWISSMAQGAVGPGDTQPATNILSEYLGQALSGLATLPKRATEAAGSLQRGGSYDPGPALEAAGLVMGGTSFGAPRGALGAGPTSPAKKSVDAETQKLLDEIDKIMGSMPKHEPKPEPPPSSMAKTYLEPKATLFGKELPMTQSEFDAIVNKTIPTSTPPKIKYDPYNNPIKPPEMAWKEFNEAIAKQELLAKESSYKGISSPGIPVYTRPRATAKSLEFEPLDWRSEVSPHATEFSRNIPRHAEELGFNPNVPLFKGRASERPIIEKALPDPRKKEYEPGLFFAEDPEIARNYGSQMAEYVARAENPAQINWEKFVGDKGYSEEYMTKILESAQRRGHDLLKITNMRDMGGHQNQYVVLDPTIARFPHAAFDPLRLKDNNLLGGIAGTLGGLAGLESMRNKE